MDGSDLTKLNLKAIARRRWRDRGQAVFILFS